MKGVLDFIAIFFSLGIIYTYIFRVYFWFLCLIVLFFICVSFFLLNKKNAFDFSLLALAFILGSLSLKNAYIIPKSDISRYSFYNKDKVCAIKGFVNSFPFKRDGRVYFIFRVTTLQEQEKSFIVCGDIFVSSKPNKRLSYGDELILIGKPKRSYYLRKNNALMTISIKSNTELIKLNVNRGRFLKKLAFYLRGRVGYIFKRYLSPLASSITSAMVLGDKNIILPGVYDSMIKIGAIHIMVVSGFHVGVIAFISGLAFKAFRINRRLKLLGIVFCMVIYCLLTGSAIPVVRATIMGIFLSIGVFFEREQSIEKALSLSALIILATAPKSLFSISFQLSFVSVISIVYLYPRIRRLFKVEGIKIIFLRKIIESLFISFSAWLGTAGLIAYYFKLITLVATLANIFIIPVASLVIISGLILVIFAFVSPSLSGAFAAFNELIVFLLVKLSAFFSYLPLAYFRL